MLLEHDRICGKEGVQRRVCDANIDRQKQHDRLRHQEIYDQRQYTPQTTEESQDEQNGRPMSRFMILANDWERFTSCFEI